jgi:hypothetical protein
VCRVRRTYSSPPALSFGCFNQRQSIEVWNGIPWPHAIFSNKAVIYIIRCRRNSFSYQCRLAVYFRQPWPPVVGANGRWRSKPVPIRWRQLVYLIYTATKEDRLILHPRYAYQYGGPTYSLLIEANEFSPERPEKYCRHILPLEWHGSTVMQIAGEEFTAINYVEPHAG